jgi:hypothetical protein
MNADPWPRGDTIVIKEVWHRKVWAARPMTVVEDQGDSAVLWLPKGSRWRAPVAPPTRPRDGIRLESIMASLELNDWVLEERTEEYSSLWLINCGAGHTVRVFWDPNDEFVDWYVNLEEPCSRTWAGFEFMDLMLDIVVQPDLSWHIKDEDEFEAMLSRGLIDKGTAQRVRAEAHSVIRRIEARVAPFCDPWPEWRPDPTWPIPALPGGWEQL